MKYPLSLWQRFWLETTCFFLGHKWKGAPQRETQYHGLYEDEVPYAYRKSTGNYMYEDISWWKAKCVRCREKLRDNEPWFVWHQELRSGIRGAFWSLKWHGKYLLVEEKEVPLWRRLLVFLPVTFAQAWFQFFVAFDRVPWSWWTWASDMKYWCYEQLEKGRNDTAKEV